MATSHPVETPVESDVDIDEAVKQILAEMEAEEQDPQCPGRRDISSDDAGGPAPVSAV